ncbi:response regulator [Eubacterium xylanophilum]|uniref:response regulator n=1 Tax=Eubacterium xylanophilum TaxID=39497 RepID=UPI0004B35F63|nr:response regulator [Eubacterium xylanophilum]
MGFFKFRSPWTKRRRDKIIFTAIVGVLIVASILIIGTIWTGRSASTDANKAVRNVSLLYLDELAGRREQVVAQTLEGHSNDLDTAVGLLEKEDLSSVERLQAYQARMKQLYSLEKFAFVDEHGVIYTSRGTRKDIESYDFDYKTISGRDISVKNSENGDSKIIIAAPVDRLNLCGNTFVACFMEMDMDHFLSEISLQTSSNNTTFCNIYKSDGMSFTGLVLGGLSAEDNLLKSMNNAKFDKEYNYKMFREQFTNNKNGIVSFTYNGIQETLSYTPIHGTDWMLTYLIRESVISDQIDNISDGIIRRSFILSLIIAAVLLVIAIYLVFQTRNTVKLISERETSEMLQQELEERIALQDELLEQEQMSRRQDNMITALASDYRSVYYINLDTRRGICYRSDDSDEDGILDNEEGFDYLEKLRKYAEKYVTEEYREAFLKFTDPDEIRKSLDKNRIISIRYLVRRGGEESYEMLRMAGVRKPDEREDHIVHAIGAGFTDIDAEMRESLAKNQALSDALETAEEASRAKTVFLSNMSHEIRTPMNAIIGLDSLALRNQELPEETREYLDKIGESARHLLGLINDILDMSRIESGRMVLRNEEFSFRSMLEQINTMVMSQCSEKGLKYECSVMGGVADFYIGDDMKLKQVIINIISNAIKFTDAPGSVTLKVDRTNVFEGRSTLRFVIKDTGIGIEEAFIPKIFEPFTQEDNSRNNKYGSTGLGMAITKNIVDLMNGTISVESKKGEGTEFTVVVTLNNCDYSNVDSSFINLKDLRILVVDDEEVAAEHARLVLDEAGIKSDIALSGEEALNMIEVAHTKQEHYGLVLLDWKMPEMDGLEVARRIRERYDSETTVIILTSFNWDEIIDEALHAGVDSFLAKPLFASNVLDEFERIARKNNSAGIRKKHSAELRGRRILLAEDMEINAEIMKEVLAIKELITETASNGKIALDMFNNSEEYYYDAILMDVRMPEMDGLEATVAIRELDRKDAKNVPIIALTANAFDEDVQRSLQVGMNAHLSKPVEPERLYGCLEELIGLRDEVGKEER